MSVSIKNMDMPKNCDECLFGDWSNLHQTAACKLLEYEPCFADFSREYESARSVKCPLVASTIELLAQPEQRWIPCDKGEPDEDMECWVTVKTTDALYRGNFTKRYGERRDKGFITSGGFMWWNTALAWMPIYEPEPYKRGQDGSNKD